MPLLFSYGTLQQVDVQLTTFGRKLSGTPDSLIGYEQQLVAIDDPEVIRTSGKTHHPIVKYTGNAAAKVAGTVFEITARELERADRYEVSAYRRVAAPLLSGRTAWVYVDARSGTASGTPDGVVTVTPDLDQSVAQAMEADVRLLPLLPELLADLWELGPSAEQVIAALESAGVEPDSTVLDLACGKGAVAVAVAEQLDARVRGIDAFEPFLQDARALAMRRGVADQCRFEQGDIRNLLGREEQYDVALLLSVGPVLGNYEQTVAGLRGLVRAGGYIVIEDGFLVDGVAHLPQVAGYASRSETLRQLTACGDIVIQEIICPAEYARSVNRRNTGLIRQRASRVRASHPAFEQLIDEYVARQERETQVLGTDVHCAIWVLRRA